MPAPPAPPLLFPEAVGAEGFAASLGVREPRKYQTPRAMPAITSSQTHQRLFDGLSAVASVAERPPDSGRSIELSCPIHPLLTGSKCTSLVRASLPKAGPSWETPRAAPPKGHRLPEQYSTPTYDGSERAKVTAGEVGQTKTPWPICCG